MIGRHPFRGCLSVIVALRQSPAARGVGPFEVFLRAVLLEGHVRVGVCCRSSYSGDMQPQFVLPAARGQAAGRDGGRSARRHCIGGCAPCGISPR